MPRRGLWGDKHVSEVCMILRVRKRYVFIIKWPVDVFFANYLRHSSWINRSCIASGIELAAVVPDGSRDPNYPKDGLHG